MKRPLFLGNFKHRANPIGLLHLRLQTAVADQLVRAEVKTAPILHHSEELFLKTEQFQMFRDCFIPKFEVFSHRQNRGQLRLDLLQVAQPLVEVAALKRVVEEVFAQQIDPVPQFAPMKPTCLRPAATFPRFPRGCRDSAAARRRFRGIQR